MCGKAVNETQMQGFLLMQSDQGRWIRLHTAKEWGSRENSDDEDSDY